jgi:hypothetical protein
MDRACSTSGGEEERIYVIGGEARRNETTGKTKMWIALRGMLEREDGAVWSGLVWHRIATSG